MGGLCLGYFIRQFITGLAVYLEMAIGETCAVGHGYCLKFGSIMHSTMKYIQHLAIRV